MSLLKCAVPLTKSAIFIYIYYICNNVFFLGTRVPIFCSFFIGVFHKKGRKQIYDIKKKEWKRMKVFCSVLNEPENQYSWRACCFRTRHRGSQIETFYFLNQVHVLRCLFFSHQKMMWKNVIKLFWMCLLTAYSAPLSPVPLSLHHVSWRGHASELICSREGTTVVNNWNK